MNAKSDFQSSHVINLSGKCDAGQDMDTSIGNPKPLFVIVLNEKIEEKEEKWYKSKTYYSDDSDKNNHSKE